MKAAGAPRAVVVLISGRGTNMLALVRRSREPGCAFRVARVISDRPAAAGLAAAAAAGVSTASVPAAHAEERSAYDRRLAQAVGECDPALIVLAGFMRILSAEFVERHAGRILNIHPSLLPKYPGLHTHRRVLAAGDTVHGATVHFVNGELDGGPAVLQVRVPVVAGDDEASLAARVQAGEHRIYPLAVDWACTDRLLCRDGRAWLDGEALGSPLLIDADADADAASPVPPRGHA